MEQLEQLSTPFKQGLLLLGIVGLVWGVDQLAHHNAAHIPSPLGMPQQPQQQPQQQHVNNSSLSTTTTTTTTSAAASETSRRRI